MKNDLSWLRLKTGIGLNFSYKRKRFNFSLSTPITYQLVSLTEESNNNQQKHKLLFDPSLHLKYIISSRWELSANYGFYNDNPTLSTLYSGYILQNYRTLSVYQNELSNSNNHSSSLTISYKNILNFLFADMSINYNNFQNEVMYEQTFEGSSLKITQVDIKNSGDYFGINGRINKGFDWEKLSFNLAGSWGKGSTPILRNNHLIKYENQGININLTTSLEITKRIIFSEKISWSYIMGKTGEGEKTAPMNNFVNSANIDIGILQNLFLSATCDYFNINNSEITQHFSLFDVGISYNLKKVRLSLSWNNIFNTKNYVYSYYGSLNTYYSEYRIRPSSILVRARFKLF